MDDRFSLAISSGHRKTHYVVLDREERRAHFYEDSFSICTHLNDLNESIDRVRWKLNSLPIPGLNLANLFAAVVLPGVTTGDPAPRQLLDAVGLRRSIAIDDTMATLIAELGSPHGICAFAGTGASVFCGVGYSLPALSIPMLPTRPDKLDGYGPLFGDHGSDFRFVNDVLTRAFRLFDVHGKSPDILRWVYESDPESLADPPFFAMQFVNTRKPHEWPSIVHKISTAIVRHLEMAHKDGTLRSRIKDDYSGAYSIAHDALVQCAVEMARTVKIALDRFPDDIEYPIICQGRMFRSSLYYEAFKQQLGNSDQISLAKYNCLVGGLMLSASHGSPPYRRFEELCKEYPSIEGMDGVKSGLM